MTIGTAHRGQNGADNVARAGSERDAQSDLASALRHGVTGEAGQPDDREQDGHGTQDRDHRERGGGFLHFPVVRIRDHLHRRLQPLVETAGRVLETSDDIARRA